MDSDYILNGLTNEGPLIVAFGSHGGNFTFLHTLERLGCPFICLKDGGNNWYSGGADGFNSIDETTAFLSHHMRPQTLFIGSSMGGFGALYFARLCTPSGVFAINPQVFIDKAGREAMRDGRWASDVDRIHSQAGEGFANAIANWTGTPVEAHFAGADNRDTAHAACLAQSVPSARVHIHEGCGHHDLPKLLRDNGTLNEVLCSAAFNYFNAFRTEP